MESRISRMTRVGTGSLQAALCVVSRTRTTNSLDPTVWTEKLRNKPMELERFKGTNILLLHLRS